MPAVGLIGLGRIGSRLAANMLAEGLDVVGCDVVAKPEFEAAGGRFVRTPADVARATDLILHSLPDAASLAAVLEGADGLLAHCGPRHIVADISAYMLADKVAGGERLAKVGTVFLDCQISGSPEMLVQKRGVIFVSGDRAAADKCSVAFAAAVPKHIYVGPFGAATRLKTANNLLVGLNTAAAAEALAMAVNAGIDPKIAIEVMGTGAATSQMFVQRAPMMAKREYPNASSTLVSFTIFLDLIEAELAGSSIHAPLARAAVDLYRRAIASGLGDSELSSIYELIHPKQKPPGGSP
jgi:3-hydroxyisobutyrate dehydrogenase